jgi:hypothetical protein
VMPEGSPCATFTLSPPTDNITSLRTNPPTRSLSCTRDGCSAASAPSGPRRGTTASSTPP